MYACVDHACVCMSNMNEFVHTKSFCWGNAGVCVCA
jgi:hypothetical protein